VQHSLAQLVTRARETTDGDTGSALILVLHRLRQRRAEDEPARAELAELFASPGMTVAVNPPVAA
jgi:hypothetical protein